jgi:hypothetical protein
MRDHLIVEQRMAPGYGPSKFIDERHALVWADIAGLVEVSADGSWTPTARAVEYIRRRNTVGLAAGAQAAPVGPS